MQGYDPQAAFEVIAAKIDRKHFAAIADKIDVILRKAIDFDLAFMQETGVINAQGLAGDAYYDDDEAFEYIVEHVVEDLGLSDEAAVLAGSLIDDFTDAQQSYLEEIGLLDWE